jgi:type VI secretion system protein ImpA
MTIRPVKDVVAISEDKPCGEDLFGDDGTFMSFTVKAEGLLPASFYSKTDGSPFDRNSVDLPGECKTGESLASRTHDIRLLTILARLHALNRDAAQVAVLMERIAALLATYWDDVHPRAEQGDFSYRMACLQALDDNAHVVLPLQYSTLLRHPRAGDISLRAILLATGKIDPREGEQPIDASDLKRAMAEIDLEALRAAHDLFARLADAVTAIRATWLDRAGYDQAVRFDLLAPFAEKGRDILAGYLAGREPDAGTVPGAATGTDDNSNSPAVSGSGSVGTFADAGHALSAAADFFARHEPSNPALPLIRQAQQLMGKSFVDVLRILAPNHVEAACLNIGKGPSYLQFPVERLAEFSALPDSPEVPENSGAFVANSRHEAIGLLTSVNAFYAKSEPSSPLPLFTERASALAGKDFLGIIRDILPEDAMKAVERTLP